MKQLFCLSHLPVDSHVCAATMAFGTFVFECLPGNRIRHALAIDPIQTHHETLLDNDKYFFIAGDA
jgi:hypothetical protein